MKITSVRGFRDILPEEAAQRRCLLRSAIGVLEAYGYKEVELPLIEKGELFSRSVGSATDIVEKEMYAFDDRDGTLVALRPEGTASLVRAYLEAGLARALPVARLYYHGPMFRRERPQRGRYRQFSQIGAELLGRDDAESDAEMICLVDDLCRGAGLGDVSIEINSLGDAACRPSYRRALIDFAHQRRAELCEDCQNRLERNPLRILDCKNQGCREASADAPMMIDCLCSACDDHHQSVLALLAAVGVDVTPNPRMVRGLDYYCRTAFEIRAGALGAQDAVGGGGRYDGLVAELGGPEMAGVGFAFGLERMQLAVEHDTVSPPSPEFFVVPIGAAASAPALIIARRLRGLPRVVELGVADKSLKAQLKRADKISVRYVVILGDEELSSGRATVRDLEERKDYQGCFGLADSADEIVAGIQRAQSSEA